MSPADGIVVTTHAVEQLRMRDPTLREHRNLTAFMFREIREAIDAHRRATRPPRWTRQRAGRFKKQGERARSVRYVWDEGERRCYVLRQSRKTTAPRADEFGRSWVVVTVYVRREGATA